MSETDRATATLAARFFTALEKGDADDAGRCYASDARIWHNSDGVEQTREQNIATLPAFFQNVTDRRFTEIRLETFAGGFVRQHILNGKLADGTQLALPLCVVCRVSDGLITRLDEYFDPAGGTARRA